MTTILQHRATKPEATVDVASPAGGGLQTPEITWLPGSEVESCLREWAALEERLGDVPLACSLDWTHIWLEHYGDLVPHRFAIGRIDGQVVGICLVTEGVEQREGPFRIRTVHLGTSGEPDAESVCVEYNDLLAEPQHRAAFAEALLREINSQRGWESFCLDGFAAQDDPLTMQNISPTTRRESLSYYFDLAELRQNGGEILDRLGRSTRKSVKRNRNAYGDVSVDWSETVEEAESIFADLMRLHQARWTALGEPGAYASERFCRFHRSLIQCLVPQGRMAFFRVRQGHETIGCLQLFVDRNRILQYQSGWVPPESNRSPGILVDYLALQECFDRGYDAYDFLGGGSRHKQGLSTDHHVLLWSQVRRPGWKFAVLGAGRVCKAKLREFRRKRGEGR